jgi:hypothetical protein
MNLYDHQKRILNLISQHDRLYIEANRQTGISTVLQLYALISARDFNKKILVLTHNTDCSNMWSNNVHVHSNGTYIESGRRQIKFNGGGLIIFKSYTHVESRGTTGYRFDNIILDHCPIALDNIEEMLSVIIPVMNLNGKIIYALTGHDPKEIGFGFYKYNMEDNEPKKLLKRK